MNARCALAGMGALALLGPLAAGVIYAQAKPARFAIASIRLGERVNSFRPIQFGFQTDPTRLTAENVSLKELITYAYRLRSYQLVAPDWMSDERFTISGTTKAPLPADQMRELLQPFLTKQFAIKSHRETKVEPVYELRLAPGGIKLPLSGDTLTAGASVGKFNMLLTPEGLKLAGTVSLDQIAEVLSQSLDLPVVNKTGVSGVYKIGLTFAPPDGRVTMGRSPHIPQLNGQPMRLTAPSVFKALPEQLGLSLEKTKAPVELLVIDAANKKPLGN